MSILKHVVADMSDDLATLIFNVQVAPKILNCPD
jgi:hypothetical protein